MSVDCKALYPEPYSKHPNHPGYVLLPLGESNYALLLNHEDFKGKGPCALCPSFSGTPGKVNAECSRTPCGGGIFVPYIKAVEYKLQGLAP